MAVRVNIHTICDRCEKPFDMKQQGLADSLPTHTPNVYTCTIAGPEVTDGNAVLFRFEDLCPDCRTTVENLIGRIKLEKPVETKKPHKDQASPPTADAGTAF